MRATADDSRPRNRSLVATRDIDPLTGLFNRRHFHEFMRVDRRTRASQRRTPAGAPQNALLLLDLDHFKRVNDRHGHAAGDAVLVEVARRMSESVRDEDHIVRWGGEEFLVYATLRPADRVHDLAGRLLDAIGSRPFVVDGIAIPLTTSIGYLAQPLPPDAIELSWREAFDLADMALYLAKAQGRNRGCGVVAMPRTADGRVPDIGDDLAAAAQAGARRAALPARPARPRSAPASELALACRRSRPGGRCWRRRRLAAAARAAACRLRRDRVLLAGHRRPARAAGAGEADRRGRRHDRRRGAAGAACARAGDTRVREPRPGAARQSQLHALHRRRAALRRLERVRDARALSLAPRQWCFPVAGCVAYRGYFAEADARAEAARLDAAGDDVHVSGVPAYSTLGWFDDPALSTFIRWREVDLARLVFHELAHQVVYVKDDTSFNESFATAVEEEGLAALACRAVGPRPMPRRSPPTSSAAGRCGRSCAR